MTTTDQIRKVFGKFYGPGHVPSAEFSESYMHQEFNALINYKAYTEAHDRELSIQDVLTSHDGTMLPEEKAMFTQRFEQHIARIAEEQAGIPADMLADVSIPADTTVEIMMDVSGSQRGRLIIDTAKHVVDLSRNLDTLGISHGISAYTTMRWKGGSAREDWLAAGRPLGRVGRLTDLAHITFKTPESDAAEAQNALYAFSLRHGLMRENIDGEAIMWAHRRLMQRPQSNKILMVVSDEAPVDDATMSVNGDGYLRKHLKEVLKFVNRHSSVKLASLNTYTELTKRRDHPEYDYPNRLSLNFDGPFDLGEVTAKPRDSLNLIVQMSAPKAALTLA